MLSKDIAKIQNMVVSNVPIDSRDIVHPEVIETDFRKRRRNIYKLAVRVSKLRSVDEIMLYPWYSIEIC